MTVELLQLLLLIIIANGAPVLAHTLLQERFNCAVDFDRKLPDQQRIFGDTKTWRGLVAAFATTATAAWLLGLSAETGLQVAAFAHLGDLLSSFIKRRLGMAPSSMAPLLDQIPESLFPALALTDTFKLEMTAIMLLVFSFIIIELALSHLLFRIGLRNRPY